MPSSQENFKKYQNPFFIETGSHKGEGIDSALSAGFERVISIELSDEYFSFCVEKFKNTPSVKIVKGDSYKVLPEILSEVKEKITFWLDGHYSCGNTAMGDYWSPLMQELDAIKNHPIKEHTIMIDDVRCWQKHLTDKHGFWIEDVEEKLKEKNEKYTLEYIDGTDHNGQPIPNDILVARI